MKYKKLLISSSCQVKNFNFNLFKFDALKYVKVYINKKRIFTVTNKNSMRLDSLSSEVYCLMIFNCSLNVQILFSSIVFVLAIIFFSPEK